LILVFGASGFLGSAITNKLAQDHEVIAVVRPMSMVDRIVTSNNITVVTLNETSWPEVIQKYKPNIIICAQWNGVEKDTRNKEELQLSNIEPILKIAKEAKLHKIRKFVALGSQAESCISSEPIKESQIDSGDSWYGKSKSLLNKSLRELFSDSETSLIWARVFSVYGPGESRDSIIPSIAKCNENGEVFSIHEPNRLWSFLFIDDFASAIESTLAIEAEYKVLNIANPNLSTIREICTCLENARVEFKNEDMKLVDGFFPDTQTLTALGWRPKVDLKVGCRISWNHLIKSSPDISS
jgi:nucleoside-diphosphate-sugar epimerase